MTSTSVYSTFIVMLVVAMTKEYIYAEAKEAPSIAAIKQELETLCNDVETLPERICDYAIDGFETRASNECQRAVESICDKIPWALTFLLSTSTCKTDLEKYLCGPLEEVFNYAKSECIEELEKIVIGNECDAQGTRENLCNDLLTPVDGVCTLVVDTMCDELPFILDPLAPYCEDFLDEYVCEKVSSL